MGHQLFPSRDWTCVYFTVPLLLFGCGARSAWSGEYVGLPADATEDSETGETPSLAPTAEPAPSAPPSTAPAPTPTVTPVTTPALPTAPATDFPVSTPAPTTTTSTEPSPTQPGFTGDPGWGTCTTPLSLDFAPAGGGTYTSFSTDATNTATTVCGMGWDVVLRWTAPQSGVYAFSTENTAYNAALAIYEDGSDCSAPLACQWGYSPSGSYLEHYAAAGETYLLAIESGDRGRFSLTVSGADSPTCSPMDLGSELPVRYVGDFVTESTVHAFTSRCNSTRRSVAFLFTPPEDGTFRFSTEGSSFDTVLVVARDCFTEPLACNDDGGRDLSSRLDLSLAQNERVVIFVASIGQGPAVTPDNRTYALSVQRAPGSE